ncbi:aquaporin AQPAe.a [Manduca sexta]|uniref:Uncharacterized protein n=1 Tax=Manduca sexta TaxID=7130 RepID=A0A922CXR0_MANSE|nr:aquaporin AQPAe.a [Manduca sexta]KAG6462202.1 hypothetical protein O3G_MSEX013116 [Manduca sexta]
MPVPDDRERAGIAAWILRWWRALVAELIATALLVGLGVATLMPVKGIHEIQLTHPALAFGFIVTGNAMIFGPASGAHMNPAVTLAAVVHGRMSALLALAYFVAQTAGALIGFGALLAMTPANAAQAPHGCTAPGPNVSPLAAAAMEAVMTGLLALGCCAAWAAHDDARPDHTVPIKLGLLVAGLVYSGGFLSAASLNPVRSLAPAVFHSFWQSHWVYWVGPLGGAALAAALHRFVLTERAPRRAAPEQLPLNDKP